jgi:hypothetical protein
MTRSFACLLLLAACSDSSAPDEEHPDAEGCEHLQDGPAVALTAGSVADDSAPAVAADHRRYDIALSGEATSVVRFAAGEATDHVFFLDADLPLAFVAADGAVVEPEEKLASSSECADIAARYTVPLEVGTYYLRFGITAAAGVSLVVEEADHDHG